MLQRKLKNRTRTHLGALCREPPKAPKYHTILIFVAAKKMQKNAVISQCLTVLIVLVNNRTMSTIDLCNTKAIFWVFMKTKSKYYDT